MRGVREEEEEGGREGERERGEGGWEGVRVGGGRGVYGFVDEQAYPNLAACS